MPDTSPKKRVDTHGEPAASARLQSSLRIFLAVIAGAAAIVGAVIAIQAYLEEHFVSKSALTGLVQQIGDPRYLRKEDAREVALYWNDIVAAYGDAIPLYQFNLQWMNWYTQQSQIGLPFPPSIETQIKQLRQSIIGARIGFKTKFREAQEQAKRLNLPVPLIPEDPSMPPLFVEKALLKIDDNTGPYSPPVMKK